MKEFFDFIVVGAGSAGCALARRLSDDEGVSVALLEAGGQPSRPEIAEPSDYYKLWGSEVDWKYQSTPQAGTANRKHALPRGRVLGGTSALNGMVYLRGDQTDFDGWARDGCLGWDWLSVRSTYEELEQLLHPSIASPTNEISRAFVSAAQEAGFAYNDSFDGGSLDGCGWNRLSIYGGGRQSSYRAFVEPVLGRRNLTVMPNLKVEKLLISKKGDVTGVSVLDSDGRTRQIQSGEVIVSAGAYDSPRLLMNSGIGPASHLRENNISPIVDLPVGENLQDHLLVGIVYTSKLPIAPLYAHITECCAFSRSTPDESSSNIEISFNKEMHFAPPNSDGKPRFTIIPGATRLASRGTVRLNPVEESSGLDIDHNYFAEASDMQVMIEAFRQSRAIANSPALSEWSSEEYSPGSIVETDNQIKNYIINNVSTWFHPAGTCRMGVDSESVVDPKLRVLGTSGLRVADASIMPRIVSANTNAATMMIGWKAASLILN